MKKKRIYTKNVDNPRRNFSMEYFLPVDDGKEKRVCKSFFKKVFLVSDGRISRLVKSKTVSKSPPEDKRGKHTPYNRTQNLKILEVKDYK